MKNDPKIIYTFMKNIGIFDSKGMPSGVTCYSAQETLELIFICL